MSDRGSVSDWAACRFFKNKTEYLCIFRFMANFGQNFAYADFNLISNCSLYRLQSTE